MANPIVPSSSRTAEPDWLSMSTTRQRRPRLSQKPRRHDAPAAYRAGAEKSLPPRSTGRVLIRVGRHLELIGEGRGVPWAIAALVVLSLLVLLLRTVR